MANDIIYANTEQLDKIAEFLKTISKRQAAEEMNGLLKTAERNVRSNLPRLIPKQFAISANQVKKSISHRKVRGNIHQGEQSLTVDVVGKRLTLSDYEHSPMLPPGQGNGNRYSVSVKIYNDRGNTLMRRIIGPDGRKKSVFIAPSSTKTVGAPYLLFRRTGKYHQSLLTRKVGFTSKGKKVKFKTGLGKEKITALHGMAIPQMVTSSVVTGPLLEALDKSISRKTQKMLNNIMEGMK